MDSNKTNAADNTLTIDLMDVFFLIRANILWFLLFAVLGGLFAGLITRFFIPNEYKSTSAIYIVSASNNSVVNLSDLQIGTNLTADYKEILMSRPVLESVKKNLNLPESVGALRSMLSIQNTSGTRIMKISVTSGNPQLSADIANEVARIAVRWIPEVMECNAPNIIEDAIPPTSRSSPSMTRNVAIGMMIGVVALGAFLVIRMLTNDTIDTAEDMERYFGVMPLTVIPETHELDEKPIARDSGDVVSEQRVQQQANGRKE